MAGGLQGRGISSPCGGLGGGLLEKHSWNEAQDPKSRAWWLLQLCQEAVALFEPMTFPFHSTAGGSLQSCQWPLVWAGTDLHTPGSHWPWHCKQQLLMSSFFPLAVRFFIFSSLHTENNNTPQIPLTCMYTAQSSFQIVTLSKLQERLWVISISISSSDH